MIVLNAFDLLIRALFLQIYVREYPTSSHFGFGVLILISKVN